MTRVYLGLGSNIDREHNLRGGVARLRESFPGLRLSTVYESEAVGFDGAPFFNLVAEIDTTMTVGALAARLREIESEYGRVRGEKKFASRTLDIDILTYGDLAGEVDGIMLPRDEILKYAFVLQPLAELAPDVLHPVERVDYRTLLAWACFDGQKLWPVALDLAG